MYGGDGWVRTSDLRLIKTPLYQLSYITIVKLAGPVRFELTTNGFGDRYSAS